MKNILLATLSLIPCASMAQQALLNVEHAKNSTESRPNVILVMADDLGYGDVGFTGNPVVKTPNLNKMAEEGVTFSNFYTASSVSSPTRGSVLTGRSPFRFGVLAAHTAGLRTGELTVAEVLKKNGYRTGFFGKWHLGGVTPDRNGRTRGYYTPPQEHGFEEVFATESAVPTWNPTLTPATWKGWGGKSEKIKKEWTSSRYFHNGELETENLSGDDSRIIMDRVESFIRASKDQPFLATVWFHTPHQPVVAGPEYLAMYPDQPEGKKHLYGAITAMDEQIGRLRKLLKDLGKEENTIIFFCSDNGPDDGLFRKGVASAGKLRGHKHQMYEGGIHVPSLMVWKGKLKEGTVCPERVGTVDYLPTILDLLDLPAINDRPIDGVSMVPVLAGKPASKRTYPLAAGFMRLYDDLETYSLIEGDYKICIPVKRGKLEMYNLKKDPYETTDISTKEPEIFNDLKEKLEAVKKSWLHSRDGGDYEW